MYCGINSHYRNIKETYNKFVVKLQESFSTIGSNKRVQLILEYIDIKPNDVLLDVGGNTGKITEVYAKGCKEIVVLEPKHAVVEYGRRYRPHIKFVEGEVENIPLSDEYFDKVVDVSEKVLSKTSRSLARYIGASVWKMEGDIRDAISIGKLVRKSDGHQEIELIIKTMMKYAVDGRENDC